MGICITKWLQQKKKAPFLSLTLSCTVPGSGNERSVGVERRRVKNGKKGGERGREKKPFPLLLSPSLLQSSVGQTNADGSGGGGGGGGGQNGEVAEDYFSWAVVLGLAKDTLYVPGKRKSL